MIYAFLPRKDEKNYRRLFDALKAGQPDFENSLLEPKHTMLDFEKAIVNAIGISFPTSKRSACYFHLVQSLFRNFDQKIGKARQKEKLLRAHIRYLPCLPFFHASDVIGAFEWLNTCCLQDFEIMMDYFETYYI